MVRATAIVDDLVAFLQSLSPEAEVTRASPQHDRRASEQRT
jgi:hypothetical protein